jgi:N-acetylmuramoyl-L-alanine amidase CwlA
MKIVQNLVPESKYSIKCPYSMKPTRIVVHNTANDAPAKNEIAYMIRNNNQVSFHYAVDDVEVVQGIPENRNAWHSGDGSGKGNREGIAIEICYSKSGGAKFNKAEENAVELIVDILKRYGWGIDKVTKHQDYSGKYCPHRTLDMGWDRFIKMISAKLNEQSTTPTTKPVATTSTTIKKGDKVKVNKGAKDYNGTSVASFVYNGTFTVDELKGDRAVLDKNGICTAFNVKNLTLAKATTTPKIQVGSTVKLNKGAKTYTGGNLASFVYNRKHKVKEISGSRVVITYLGIVIAAVNIKDLTLA